MNNHKPKAYRIRFSKSLEENFVLLISIIERKPNIINKSTQNLVKVCIFICLSLKPNFIKPLINLIIWFYFYLNFHIELCQYLRKKDI